MSHRRRPVSPWRRQSNHLTRQSQKDEEAPWNRKDKEALWSRKDDGPRWSQVGKEARLKGAPNWTVSSSEVPCSERRVLREGKFILLK